MDGFHYEGSPTSNLQFFATAEGYVNVTKNKAGANVYSHVFNYTDHLGNIRLSYTLVPNLNQTGFRNDILEENHYYPFGLKHKKYGSVDKQLVLVEGGGEYWVGIAAVPEGDRKTYQYKYNGKEFQDELGLNFYDYGARNYDAALGRWNVTDNKAELYFGRSPYIYALNTPVQAIDPDGNLVIFINGQHTGDGGKSEYWRKTEQREYSTAFGPMTTKVSMNFDQAVMNRLGDYNVIYRDGSMGGFANTFTGGGSIFGALGTIFGTSNLNPKTGSMVAILKECKMLNKL